MVKVTTKINSSRVYKIMIFSLYVLTGFLTLSRGLNGAATFKQIDQWKIETEPFGRRFASIIDNDNHVIGAFYKSPMRVISATGINKFGSYGQGPNDLMDVHAFFLYKGNLAIVERHDRVKIFSKKNGNYTWKETKLFKPKAISSKFKDVLYFENKFFFAGSSINSASTHSQEVPVFQVFDNDGNLLKQLIHKNPKEALRLWEMRYYVEAFGKDTVLFLAENELKAKVISSKTLDVNQEVNLEAPYFYKKKPEDFYKYRRYEGYDELNNDLEKWALGYSAITGAVFFQGKLILQVRTCSDKLKKFALLVYDTKTWKLESTFFINDLLLGSKDGKFYFFANGNPGRDDDTDDCIINIYSLIDSEKDSFNRPGERRIF